ncbi:hypothetical protein DFJ74DRAFT_691181 [Hyaloraphidium curvatum]|nr:hypothetical protein DFJ74DRAFT_691181 [Hyaloraphidium curvatum]
MTAGFLCLVAVWVLFWLFYVPGGFGRTQAIVATATAVLLQFRISMWNSLLLAYMSTINHEARRKKLDGVAGPCPLPGLRGNSRPRSRRDTRPGDGRQIRGSLWLGSGGHLDSACRRRDMVHLVGHIGGCCPNRGAGLRHHTHHPAGPLLDQRGAPPAFPTPAPPFRAHGALIAPRRPPPRSSRRGSRRQ